MQKRNLIGIQVCVTDYGEASEAICRAAATGQSFTVTALAVHGVMTGALDPMHQQRLNALNMIVPDGQPVRWGLNLLYKQNLKDRVCGPRLMIEVCRMAEAHGLSVAFYGNKAGVLEELRRNLLEAFPRLSIAAAIPSRFKRVDPEEQTSIAEQIAASGARILFVGLGCPRQEVWLFENGARLPLPAIAVGAAFDFHARRIPQAPQWMQDSGLEWLFRLKQEPRRLWRRYLLLNPLYLTMLTLQKIGLRRFDGGGGSKATVRYEGFA